MELSPDIVESEFAKEMRHGELATGLFSRIRCERRLSSFTYREDSSALWGASAI